MSIRITLANSCTICVKRSGRRCKNFIPERASCAPSRFVGHTTAAFKIPQVYSFACIDSENAGVPDAINIQMILKSAEASAFKGYQVGTAMQVNPNWTTGQVELNERDKEGKTRSKYNVYNDHFANGYTSPNSANWSGDL